MSRDPIIEEVRKLREELFARYGHDLDKYIKHLNQKPSAKPKRASKPGPQKAKAAQPLKRRSNKGTGKGRAA